MKSIFFILILVAFIETKCGLYWNFDRSTKDAIKRDSAWVKRSYGYGFQSLSTITSCNDEEMFRQCERSQQILDAKNIPVDLGCAYAIVCAAPMPGNGQFWCQNMDSYNKCLMAQVFVNSTICKKAVELSDKIPVLDYFESSPVPTTTTANVTNTTIVTTTLSEQTKPALGIILIPSGILVLLLASLF